MQDGDPKKRAWIYCSSARSLRVIVPELARTVLLSKRTKSRTRPYVLRSSQPTRLERRGGERATMSTRHEQVHAESHGLGTNSRRVSRGRPQVGCCVPLCGDVESTLDHDGHAFTFSLAARQDSLYPATDQHCLSRVLDLWREFLLHQLLNNAHSPRERLLMPEREHRNHGQPPILHFC